MKPQDTIDFHLRWGWTKLSKLYSAEAERRGHSILFVFHPLAHREKWNTPPLNWTQNGHGIHQLVPVLARA